MIGVVTWTSEVIISSDLHDDSVFEVMDQLKIDFVWIAVPHGVVLGASSSIYMSKDDELTVTLFAELLLEPEHLLNSTPWSHLMGSLRGVVEGVDGE